MTDRMDVLMVRSYQSGGERKNHYTKVGAAFALDGGGYRIKLDAVPVPTIYEGRAELTMLMLPPRDEGASQRPSQRQADAPSFDGGDADDLPF